MTNKKIIMTSRPTGLPKESNFSLQEDSQASLNQGQIRLKTLWLSLDPYMRGRMSAAKSYTAGMNEGNVMTGEIIGKVTESESKKFPEGSIVLTRSGWQSEPVVGENEASLVDPRIDPLSLALGTIGMPGLTAYFSLTRIGKPKKGETIVVSAGSGAVGATVGQIGKHLGCKIVGIAGSDEKVKYMVDDLNFDAGVNYKKETFKEDLKSSTAEGCDIYFDNVGGPVTDAVLDRLNTFSRVIVCGQISQYNNLKNEDGPRNFHKFLRNQAKLEGFIVYRWAEEYQEGIDFLLKLKESGFLKYRETVVEGIENAPEAFLKLFSGENFGKLLIKVAE